MGCVQARPSMYSPPRGVEKLKLESGYVGKSRRMGGKPIGQKQLSKESDKIFHSDRLLKPKGDGDNKEVKILGVGEVKVIDREGEEDGVGNVPQRIVNKKKVEGDELVDGWPKWLTDNIPREALVGLVPKSAEAYDKLAKIGQGTYSNVYKARDRDTGKIVALKKVRFDTSEPESVKFMAREIMILQNLDHPNVVKLEGLATSRMQYSLYLVFDFMVTDLSRVVSHPDVMLTEPQVKSYMQQLLLGLKHCHERGILHRDIKGSNLLIDKTGMLKIADFGLANYFNPNHKRPLTSRVVTLWYRAPELLLGATDYGVGIDLWSAGCLMAEMFAGKPIMPGRTEVEQLHRIFKLCGSPSEDYWKRLKLPASFRPPQPYKPSLSEAFRDFPSSSFGLLTTLLALDPSYRGTASSALRNEFFTASPKACDLSGLPVIYKEEEEPDHTSDRKKQRSSKLKQRSRTHKKNDSATEKSKGDSGSSKEEEKCDVINFNSQEMGSSTGSTSSSVKKGGNPEEISPPSLFSVVPSLRPNSPQTDGHLNASKNIKNMPTLPTTKISTINYNEASVKTYRLTRENRSVSTRDFRHVEAKKLPNRYALDDLDD
ncbi:hypothetical protein GIB67_014544 [Kingdonia uniflora]|uniref:Protein kinase domain-containing protein n=1 Tax=Kingdonia uniflora TaxID=39325 RepID=A0A7J7LK17_9MAGN|nr:hypothetical protein GIB67_014544 [Kingdonia uniflora]